MEASAKSVVTGAFGYSGKYITRLLLARGERVVNLTGHPNRPNPFGPQVTVAPFDFDNPGEMARSMEGATTLFNTYWVRFPFGQLTFRKAVENSKAIIRAAEVAGVRRIVHISIASASSSSPLPYFWGKGVIEEFIRNSKLSYAIIRPTVIFGPGEILINNISWLLRRFPVFVVAGSGEYKLQPIFVEDLAEMAVRAADGDNNIVTDAAGPEAYTFNGLVRLIAEKVGSRAKIVHVGPRLALYLAQIVGYFVNDVVLTEDEVKGLMANLLVSHQPPIGHVRLSDWLGRNTDILGVRYASELERHYR